MKDDLYPACEPYRSDYLAVDKPHRIYFEECGNPAGIPVLFLHGGPGSGCRTAHRRFFDPNGYRAVLFDQRGVGRSSPAGCTERNTTGALVDDIETLREALGIERWLLFGGSWGSTLSLVYAQTHPARVLGMVLRGIFLARPRDLEWFVGPDGVARIFPEQYARFIAMLEPEERARPVTAYRRRVVADDSSQRIAAARALFQWEDAVVTHNLPPDPNWVAPDPKELEERAAIICHYEAHDFFLGPGGAITDPTPLRTIPTVIIHGRRDLICPIENAYTLHRALPESELIVLENCGHTAGEPEMASALTRAADTMLARLTGV